MGIFITTGERTVLQRAKIVVRMHNQRLRGYGVTTSLTAREWIAILRKARGNCAICHQHKGWHFLTLDHIAPVLSGGGNTAENVQAICERCNREKSSWSSSFTEAGYISAREAAKLLDVSPEFIRSRVKSGALIGQLGHNTLVSKASAETFWEREREPRHPELLTYQESLKQTGRTYKRSVVD